MTNQPTKKEKVFDYFQMWEPNWWQKIRLFFKKSYTTCDLGKEKDKSVELTFKVLDGSIFLIKEREL